MSNDKALIEYASSIDESARFMCHVLITRTAVPAPLLYDLTGHLGAALHRLVEVADHLNRGIQASPNEYVVYDRNREPGISIEMASAELATAAGLLTGAAECIARTQSAVNLQGYTALVGEDTGADMPSSETEGDQA